MADQGEWTPWQDVRAAQAAAVGREMLEALRAAEHWLEEERITPCQAMPDEILRVIRAAIAKAEGRVDG